MSPDRRPAGPGGRQRTAPAGPGPGELTDFAGRVLDVAESIPPGSVMSYGDIAEYLGEGGPRQVGRVMALWGGGVAWWRVIHSDGSLLVGHERAALAAGPAGWTWAVRAGRRSCDRASEADQHDAGRHHQRGSQPPGAEVLAEQLHPDQRGKDHSGLSDRGDLGQRGLGLCP
jgi:alkylated DNA nucleotide flippase Atl1